jgi:hypothetical protein
VCSEPVERLKHKDRTVIVESSPPFYHSLPPTHAHWPHCHALAAIVDVVVEAPATFTVGIYTRSSVPPSHSSHTSHTLTTSAPHTTTLHTHAFATTNPKRGAVVVENTRLEKK